MAAYLYPLFSILFPQISLTNCITRIHTDHFHCLIPKVNHPGLGTPPACTRRATGCRFLHERRTYSHSEKINTVTPYWHRTEQATSMNDILQCSYTTRDTRVHFNTPPPATSRPNHTSKQGAGPTPHHPPHFFRSAWCTQSALSCLSIPDQVISNPHSNTTTNPPAL
jgi:hypothetical protein